jgi:ribosome biogenesis GTPase A
MLVAILTYRSLSSVISHHFRLAFSLDLRCLPLVMTFQTGIVGVPNVGKSSFFNLLSKVSSRRVQLDLAGP